MTRQELIEQIKTKGSFLCVGLDPDLEKMPPHLNGDVSKFIWEIIEATAKYATAFKPNFAFYECLENGDAILSNAIAYIKLKYPEILVIADAKRGDIGNTSKKYAEAIFKNKGADACTVAPYMGEDSVKPFLEFEGKWTVLLALTSNPGSQDFQMMNVEQSYARLNPSIPLYKEVLKVSKLWGTPENMMYVVGATQAETLKWIRKIVPDHFLLVPGVGAQGGSLEEVVKYGMNQDCGLLVNSSRGIIHASSGTDFAERAASEAQKLQQQMRDYLIEHNITF